MKNKILILTAVLSFFLLLGTSQVYADLIVTPSSPTPILTGNETGVPDILANIASQGYSLTEIYKQDVGKSYDEGLLAGSYITSFNQDASGGTISWVNGTTYASGTIYLLVKDGNNNPAWYLFNLSGWDGMTTIDLSKFWLGKGAISHISLYGTTSPVPEPATMLLLGSGLVGLAGFGRRRFIKK